MGWGGVQHAISTLLASSSALLVLTHIPMSSLGSPPAHLDSLRSPGTIGQLFYLLPCPRGSGRISLEDRQLIHVPWSCRMEPRSKALQDAPSHHHTLSFRKCSVAIQTTQTTHTAWSTAIQTHNHKAGIYLLLFPICSMRPGPYSVCPSQPAPKEQPLLNCTIVGCMEIPGLCE